MTGFAQAVRDAAGHGTRALTTDTETLDYAAWVARGERLARALTAEGIGPGARVAVALPNGSDLLVAYYACSRVGAIIVPLSTWATGDELRRALDVADGDLLLTSDQFPGQRDELAVLMLAGAAPGAGAAYTTGEPAMGLLPVENLLERSNSCDHRHYAQAVRAEDDKRDFAMLFTSGSTGVPKGVILSQGAVRGNGALIVQRMGLGAGDRVYSYFPMFFSGGLCNVLGGAVSVGAEVVTQPRHSAAGAARLIRDRACTARSVWHDGFAGIADAPGFGRDQLVTMSKGLLIDQPVLDRFGIEFDEGVNMYGMTETATAFTCHDFRDPPQMRRSSHGRVMDGNELRVVDPDTGAACASRTEGEIAVRGPRMMRGYSDGSHLDRVDDDGFFRTGDLGWLEADGQLHFTGRVNTLIKVGGLSLQPEQVEAALLAIPGVGRAVVVGDGLDARRLGALVVPRGKVPLDAAELTAALARQMSKYKVPEILIIDEALFPQTGTGKVDRRGAARMLFGGAV